VSSNALGELPKVSSRDRPAGRKSAHLHSQINGVGNGCSKIREQHRYIGQKRSRALRNFLNLQNQLTVGRELKPSSSK
jgi:hypothetical protein